MIITHALSSYICSNNLLYFPLEQDLNTELRCCSLDSSLKILPCGFFLMDESIFFKLSSHITES